MKVRVGYGLGVRSTSNDGERFGAFVDALEALGFDSLWLSERVTGESPDPLIGLSFAAGRTKKLKLGTSVQVLPGRNPMLVAKEWATLDRLSNGRTLPAFGLGVVDPGEQQAFGVERGERAAWFDEVLPLVRRLWTEESVDHEGPRFRLAAATVRPKPVQSPPEVWLGGLAKSELKRIGRLGDGWLPSFCTPADVIAGIPAIDEAADAAGRALDREHFGALVAYTDGELPDIVAAAIAQRRPGVEPADIIARGLTDLRVKLERFIESGASKFVVVPLSEPPDWPDELARIAAELMPLQN